MLNILMAFPYFARTSYEVFLEHKGQYRLIVDSGAFTATPVLKRFRPFSCDSSSWNGAARYARGQLYVGDGELKTFSRKQPLVVSPQTITRLQALSIPMDVISLLGHKDAYNWGFSNEFKRERICQVITTLSNIKRAYDIEKNLGTRVYLAAPTSAQLKHILHWHAHMSTKGNLS